MDSKKKDYEERDERDERLARSAFEYDLRQIKDGEIPKDVFDGFMESLMDISQVFDEANSAEMSAQMDEYQELIGESSPIPLAALWQHINAAKRILMYIKRYFARDGFSDKVKWYMDLFYIFGGHLEHLRSIYDYEFDKFPYPEEDPDVYTGIREELRNDMNAYTDEWIRKTSYSYNKLLEAWEDGDMQKVNLYLSNLHSYSRETAYVGL